MRQPSFLVAFSPIHGMVNRDAIVLGRPAPAPHFLVRSQIIQWDDVRPVAKMDHGPVDASFSDDALVFGVTVGLGHVMVGAGGTVAGHVSGDGSSLAASTCCSTVAPLRSSICPRNAPSNDSTPVSIAVI